MGLKRIFSIFILLSAIFLLPQITEAQKVKRVVIDAGHGGKDTGAQGNNSNEKDIALAIALKAGKYIEDNLSDVEVIYTRKTDVFVELYRRAKIANEAKADLFISIHCNANPSSSPSGAETYVMGLHKSEANLAVAKLENASILLEKDYHVQYDGFDPSSPEGNIFFSMLQNAFLDQSLELATFVQKHLKDKVRLFDRGVKQAGFLVLYKTTMPSILIETGFISNAHDAKILKSDEGQDKYAYAVYRAVKDYKQTVEKTWSPETPDTALASKEADTKTTETVASDSVAETQVPESAGASATTNDVAPVFRVQFLMTRNRLSQDAPELKGLEQVRYYRQTGMYKYTVGNEPTPEQAQKLIPSLVAKGFKDAFVVAFVGDERIPVDQAKKLLKN